MATLEERLSALELEARRNWISPAMNQALRNQALADTGELRQRLAGSGTGAVSNTELRAQLAAQPSAPRRVPVQSAVTPANAGGIGAGTNPNVAVPGESAEARAFREQLRATPGARPLAPVAPPVATGPAQVFQPNGPTLMQRAGEFVRSEAGGAMRAQSVPMPAAQVAPPVDPVAGARLRAAAEQAFQAGEPARNELHQRLTGRPTQPAGMQPAPSPVNAAPAATPVARPAGAPAATPATGPTAAPAANTAGAAAPTAPARTIVQTAKSLGKTALRRAAPALPFAIEAAAVKTVADDPNMTRTDVVDQAARGTGRALFELGGGALGLTGGTALGGPLLGIPAAIGGGIAGGHAYDAALEATHQAANAWRRFVGLPEKDLPVAPAARGDLALGAGGADILKPEQRKRLADGALGVPLASGQSASDAVVPPGPIAEQARKAAAPTAAAAPAASTASSGNQPGAAAAPPDVRAQLLARLDALEQADPGRILGLASNNAADPSQSFWRTADGRIIRKPVAASAEDKQLLERLRVAEGRGDKAGVFEHEGRQFANLRFGTDANGLPVFRAASLDGRPVDERTGRELLNRYDEIQRRTGPLSAEDAAAVARFEQRQQLREAINQQFEPAPAPGGAPAAAAAAAARSSASGSARDTLGARAKADGYVPFAFVQDPQQRANLQIFGHAVAAAEGADYTRLVGGKSFADFSAHPQKVGARTKDGPSTAAGRYQITGSTDRTLRQSGNFTDFSPETQDRMFMGLLASNGAMDDVAAGNFDAAMQKLGGVWQGLPSGKSKNQGKRNPDEWAQFIAEGQQLYGAGAGAGARAGAAAALPSWLDAANVVQIIRPGGVRTVAVPDPNGGAMQEISQAAFEAYRQAAAADPQLAARMRPGAGGAVVDGALIPPATAAAGASAVDEYLKRVRAGAADAADPSGAKRAEELAKREPTKPITVKRPDTDSGVSQGEVLFVPGLGWVSPPGTAPVGGWPKPSKAAVARLKKERDTAAFDAQFGPGAAAQHLDK